MDSTYQFGGAAEFTTMARSLMLANGRPSEAALYAGNTRAGAVLKAAADAGTATLGNPQWASELVQYRVVANGFLEALRNVGIFDRLATAGMKAVPVGSRVVISTVAIAGANPAETAPKPITELSLSGADIEPVKASCILVVSDEIARSTTAAGMALLSSELRNGVVAATDALFLAGLKLGEIPIASTGSDAAAVAADVGLLLAAVSSGSGSSLFLIVPPGIAKALCTMTGTDGRTAFDMTPTGGTVCGLPTLVSDGLADDEVMLIDAAQVVGDVGTVVMDASSQSSLIMDSAPTGAMAAAVNLWQLNLRALKAERHFGFQANPDAVAVVSPVAWGE